MENELLLHTDQKKTYSISVYASEINWLLLMYLNSKEGSHTQTLTEKQLPCIWIALHDLQSTEAYLVHSEIQDSSI